MGLLEKLTGGSFVTLAEINPPKGTDCTDMVSIADGARALVDAFLVPDMSNSVMRMSSLGASLILQQNGMESIMETRCSDRNRLSIQADLLSAGACGIRNVIAREGEEPSIGDHYEAKSVFDIHFPEILDLIAALNKGRDMADNELTGSPGFTVGASIEGLHSLPESAKDGLDFVVFPPVFAESSMQKLSINLEESMIPCIPTVIVLKSAGMARYLAAHYQELQIPEGLIKRVQNASYPSMECQSIAAELVTRVKDFGFGGVLVSAFGQESLLHRVLDP